MRDKGRSGYMILDSCPSLETDENLQGLIGTQIIHAWDDKNRQGWFEGTVSGRGACSTKQIVRVLALPIVLCDTPSR
jgi:hypothetical protein